MSEVSGDKVYQINGLDVHVHEEGRPGRPLVVLIHGWSSSHYALSPLLPILRERYHVLAVDLPGFGMSSAFPHRATIPAYAQLIGDLITTTSDKPAILIGHSMGGMISVSLALQRPRLVERMVLICPTISGKLSTFINMFVSPVVLLERLPVASVLFAVLEPRLFAITDRLMRPASFAARTMIREEEYHQLRADARRPFQGRVRAECYWAMRTNDLRGQLKGIDIPTLILWGMEDNTVPLRDAGAVADEWPDADLRIIPNAGHWPQFEKPDLTRRYVKAFLGQPIKLLKVDLY